MPKLGSWQVIRKRKYTLIEDEEYTVIKDKKYTFLHSSMWVHEVECKVSVCRSVENCMGKLHR